MNKSILITIVGLLILIGGALTYVLLTPKKDSSVDQSTSIPESMTSTDEQPKVDTPSTDQSGSTEEQSTTDTPSTDKPGVYIEYSESAIQSTEGTKLLFFHAPWCPQCREMEASIKADGLPSGVTVFKIDYDSNQGLRQKYGVTLQTTFVKIDDEGNKVQSYVAYEDPQFSSVERELLR